MVNPTTMPIRLPAWRARFLIMALLGCLAVLAARALYLQGLHYDFLQRKGESRYSRAIEISATRGMIVDRNNEPLAISTPVESVAASPADVEMSPEQTAKLARLLGMDKAEIARRLSDRKREFAYLKRQLPPEEAEKVVALGIPGLFLQREYRRYYPAGEVTAHIIGYTGVDQNGQEALELAFDDMLAGKQGARRHLQPMRRCEVLEYPHDILVAKTAVQHDHGGIWSRRLRFKNAVGKAGREQLRTRINERGQ